MRRVLPLLLAVGLVAGCSEDLSTTDDSAADGSSPDGSSPGAEAPTVTPSTFVKPTVGIPAELPTELVITDLAPGSGAVAQVGDGVVVHYVGVLSADGTEFDNSYDRGEPFTVNLGAGGVIQGWDEGLVGARQGMRRQLDIPAELAYGDAGSGDVIGPGDALSFVIDVVAVLPAFTADAAPNVEVEGGDNVNEIKPTDLIIGEGPVLTDGLTAVIHLVAYRADTGERLDATWGTPPLTFVADSETEVFSGIATSVNGMRVGGRRQSQIPYPLVFSGQGNDQIGLPQGVDLVIVVDLISIF